MYAYQATTGTLAVVDPANADEVSASSQCHLPKYIVVVYAMGRVLGYDEADSGSI